MKLNEKEIENVSKLESFKRYNYFIKKIADSEEFWTIINKQGDIALSEVEENTLISFWTDEDFVKTNLKGIWEKCSPFKFTFDDLENTLTSLIVDKDYLLNIFPVNGKSGFVVSIEEFLRDLNNELDKY